MRQLITLILLGFFFNFSLFFGLPTSLAEDIQLNPNLTTSGLVNPQILANSLASLTSKNCIQHYWYGSPFLADADDRENQGSGPPGSINICTGYLDPSQAQTYSDIFLCRFNEFFPSEQQANCPDPSKLERVNSLVYMCESGYEKNIPEDKRKCLVPGFKYGHEWFDAHGNVVQFQCVREDINFDKFGHYEYLNPCKSPAELIGPVQTRGACCGVPKPPDKEPMIPQFFLFQ